MTVTMDELYQRMGKVETEIAVMRSEQAHANSAMLEKLDALIHTVHGNGKPGLADEVKDMREWRQKVHWMVAGATSLASAVLALLWFVIDGGLKAVVAFFSERK